jgi:serine/threonine protein kinase
MSCFRASDLKPSNIGFDGKDQVKIFDFGLAREILEDSPNQKTRQMTGGVGTPRYMAPEVASMSDTYGFAADVYSFSILLWQIVTTRTPFADIVSPRDFASKVLKANKRPSLAQIDCPDSLKRLMETGWSADPLKRPTFSVICRELDQTLIYHIGQLPHLMDAPGNSNRRNFLWQTGSEPISIHPKHNPGPTYKHSLRTRVSQENLSTMHYGEFVCHEHDRRDAASSTGFAKNIISIPHECFSPGSLLRRMFRATIRRSASTLQEFEESSTTFDVPERDEARDEHEAPATCGVTMASH